MTGPVGCDNADERQENAIVEVNTRAGLVMPVGTVDEIVKSEMQYLELTRRILTDGDYAMIEGKKRKRKSAWRKYERAFNLSVDEKTITLDIEKDEKGRVIRATCSLTIVAPNGRRSPGWGSCSITESTFCPNGRGKHRRLACDPHFPTDGSDHNIPATAMTRARNRACGDMIGAGEVSAEELQADPRADDVVDVEGTEVPQQPKPATKARQEHGMSEARGALILQVNEAMAKYDVPDGAFTARLDVLGAKDLGGLTEEELRGLLGAITLMPEKKPKPAGQSILAVAAKNGGKQ